MIPGMPSLREGRNAGRDGTRRIYCYVLQPEDSNDSIFPLAPQPFQYLSHNIPKPASVARFIEGRIHRDEPFLTDLKMLLTHQCYYIRNTTALDSRNQTSARQNNT